MGQGGVIVDKPELMKLTKEIYNVSQRLQKASTELYKLSREMAEAEKLYRMELSKEITRLRSDGVSVTLIPDIARGNVAHLKHERDLAESIYKSAIESKRAIESQLSALQTICKYQEEL